mmetsp:Transcript_18783/g.66337  ORF Transcript_18783/g.66337 Transcript_18783/m.66337 type:complete len:869 (-) Transcript_18783:108-2714(-)
MDAHRRAGAGPRAIGRSTGTRLPSPADLPVSSGFTEHPAPAAGVGDRSGNRHSPSGTMLRMAAPRNDDATLDHVSRAALQCLRVCEDVRDASTKGGLPAGCAETLRDVGLTLATLDRSLFGFIDKILQDAGHAPLYSTVAGGGAMPDLAEAVNKMSTLPEDFSSRIPRGGVVSLLHHFYSVLDATRSAVARINAGGGTLKSVLRTLQWLGPLVTSTIVFNSRWARSMRGLRRRLLAGSSGALVLWAVWHVQYLMSAHRALRVCHSQLQLLLRIWLICVDVFTATNIQRDTSYAQLVAKSTLDDYDDSRKPEARLLLEQMSLPRGAAVWFRNNMRMQALKWFLDVLYSGMAVGYRLDKSEKWWWMAWPASIAALAYYAVRPELAADRAADLMQSPAMRNDCSFVARVWGLLDSPPMRLASSLVLPSLATSKEVNIEGVPCHAFYRGKLPGSFFSSRMPFGRRARRAEDISPDRDGDGPSSASERGGLDEDVIDLARTCSFAPFLGGREAPEPPPCLLYIHGGGFVGTSFASDAQLLARWARKSDVLIIFIHYSLAPAARFPTALEECVRVYCWLRLHSRRVAVFGESAGGNLAAALTLRCIDEEVPVPDGIVLGYPALNLNSSPSPSRALHLGDPLIPISLLIGLANAYVPADMVNKPIFDPLMCPGLATDAQLRQFPPTYIAAGGCDPLLDDAIDFNTRLRRVGVSGRLNVYRSLPHGFVAFRWLMEEAGAAVEYCRQSLVAVLAHEGEDAEEAPSPLTQVAPQRLANLGGDAHAARPRMRRRGSVGRGTPAGGHESGGTLSPPKADAHAGAVPGTSAAEAAGARGSGRGRGRGRGAPRRRLRPEPVSGLAAMSHQSPGEAASPDADR